MQRDVKIGIAIGVLLIALVGIYWMVKSRQSAGSGPDQPENRELMTGPVSPVEPVDGGGQIADDYQIPLPGETGTTLPGTALRPGTTLPGGATAGGVPPVGGTTDGMGMPIPPPPAPETYTVVANDSLSKISEKVYGTQAKWKLIADANHLSSPYMLKPGQKLIIPSADSVAPVPDGITPSPSPARRTHKVVSGDTLTSISQQYYNDVAHINAIYEANKDKLANKNDLKIGMELTIP